MIIGLERKSTAAEISIRMDIHNGSQPVNKPFFSCMLIIEAYIYH